MRIVYYTRTAFLDAALCFIREMSRRVELHVLLELSPEGWQSSLFDVAPRKLPGGIIPADPVLRECFPPGVRAYWKNTASFKLVVHSCRRSIHPAAWSVSRHAARAIRDIGPDLIYLDDVSLRLAFAIPEAGEAPICVGLHDPEPHSGEGNWRTCLARRLTFRRAAWFVLHNRVQLEAFCARYRVSPQCVAAVPLGAYEVFQEWGDGSMPEDQRTVLFFGRLSAYKGLEVLYEAAPQVTRQVPNVRFIVAGRPVQGYQLPGIPALPNGGQVSMVNKFISNPELARLFQQATIVACPYTGATQSGVVLTAYAFGKPVVATRSGGLPEYVEDRMTGILVPPQRADPLAEALICLLQDHRMRRFMSENIRCKVRKPLSWATIAEKTLEIYERILMQRGHNAASR